MEHRQGKPKDNDKYSMVSDLLIRFSSISEAALQQETISKEGVTFLHKIAIDVDNAMESIEVLLDEFYTSQKTTFEDFRGRIESLTNIATKALEEKDLKSFLLMFGEIEEGRKILDYIPYNECGWSDNELDMCNERFEVLDIYFGKLVNKYDYLFGEDYIIH